MIIIIGFITFLLAWTYVKRANLNYNAEGCFFSSEDGIVYNEQAKEVYGILSLFGLVLTGISIVKLVTKRNTQIANKA